MNNQNSNFNNDKFNKVYEYKSKMFTARKNKLINEYSKIFKSYKEICVESDILTQRMNNLKYVYEQEVQINGLYQSFSSVSKDVEIYEVPNNEIYFLEKNINELTENQRLKIKINRNAALILRMEKQLIAVNSKLDERKSHFITAYKNYLLSQY